MLISDVSVFELSAESFNVLSVTVVDGIVIDGKAILCYAMLFSLMSLSRNWCMCLLQVVHGSISTLYINGPSPSLIIPDVDLFHYPL